MKRLLMEGTDGAFLTAAEWKGGRDETLVLLSRADYEVLLLEVPPVRADRLEAGLSWRIRSFYPGSAESTELDHRPVPRTPCRRLVFAADRQRLADLRTKAVHRPFAAACLILAAAALRREADWAGVFWTSVWAEVVRFERGAIRDSRLVERRRTGSDGATGGETVLDAAQALSRILIDLPDNLPVVVAFTRDTASERGTLAEILSATGDLPAGSESRDVHREHRVVPLEELVPRRWAESCSIFQEKPPSRILCAWNIARAVAALAFLLTASLPVRISRLREAELSALKSRYEAAKDRSYDVIRRAAEYDRLTARKRELETNRRPDAYRILADLSAGSGGGIRALSLTLEDSSFHLEAEGADGLAILRRMQDSGLFSSVELRQSVAMPSGVERFILSGSVAK